MERTFWREEEAGGGLLRASARSSRALLIDLMDAAPKKKPRKEKVPLGSKDLFRREGERREGGATLPISSQFPVLPQMLRMDSIAYIAARLSVDRLSSLLVGDAASTCEQSSKQYIGTGLLTA